MKKNDIISVNTPVDAIPGISTVRKKAFETLGAATFGGLINHFPRGYQNRKNIVKLAEAPIGTPVSLLLTVGTIPHSVKLRGNLSLTKFRAFDESGSCEVVFYNRTYADKSYVQGSTHRFYGRLAREKGVLRLNSPESENYIEGVPLIPMMPVYPLTSGLTQRILQNSVRRALDMLYIKSDIFTSIPPADPIPAGVRKKYKLCSKAYAYENIHFPRDEETLKQAGDRLAFEELFLLSVRLNYSRRAQKSEIAPEMRDTDLGEFLRSLDYKLTKAQERVCAALCEDMSRSVPMSRLVSGDVGSGKTVCAAAGAYIALKNGYQAALMAPTEILARQHYNDLSRLFEKLGYKVELLIGATKASEKKRILEALRSHEIDFIIGTHSLIGDKVEFASLGLVITDEQHRFGVRQRTALGEKSKGVHVLVMSATPIPRTLALILYGDLDVSQIDEMPPGRQKVDTFVVGESYRERLNAFIRKQVDGGHRVYIVCPTVEEAQKDEDEHDISLSDFFEFFEREEKPALKSTLEYSRKLKEEIFPDLGVGYIHGKMKSAEKQAVMSDFVKGDIQILVSTTVIEVGVNVPEATLMIVENAERFGLSQLHQLRGRVGRGKDKSYCVLVSDAKAGSTSAKRLEVMRSTCDGYAIAESDLEQRGPGDFIAGGTDIRQHGRLKLKLAEFTNARLIMDASAAAGEIIADDPLLEKEENKSLREALGELEKALAPLAN
ncbi:MAG: ATP-dependent DNA helicase RecG [Clostridia bacterium]|nr:ATP-dependent DNA helicase RecG [Clostridia bacterium]